MEIIKGLLNALPIICLLVVLALVAKMTIKAGGRKRRLRTASAMLRNTVQSLGGTLANELQRVQAMTPLDGIVKFFDCVSRWHDRGLSDEIRTLESVNRHNQFNSTLDDLRTLQVHFGRAGRNECGWNRTKSGQTVTDENVFLGNIYGLWTKTVAYWKTGKNEPKGGWEGGWFDCAYTRERNAYDVVSDQARDFMASHLGPILQIIARLEVDVAKLSQVKSPARVQLRPIAA